MEWTRTRLLTEGMIMNMSNSTLFSDQQKSFGITSSWPYKRWPYLAGCCLLVISSQRSDIELLDVSCLSVMLWARVGDVTPGKLIMDFIPPVLDWLSWCPCDEIGSTPSQCGHNGPADHAGAGGHQHASTQDALWWLHWSTTGTFHHRHGHPLRPTPSTPPCRNK